MNKIILLLILTISLPATVFAATPNIKSLRSLNVVLETAETASINFWSCPATCNISTSSESAFGKSALKLSINTNVFNQYNTYSYKLNKRTDLSKFKQLSCYIKSSSTTADISLRIALKETSGEIWLQNTSSNLTNNYSYFNAALITSNFSLINATGNGKLDINSIDSIIFNFNNSGNINRYCLLDNLILYTTNRAPNVLLAKQSNSAAGLSLASIIRPNSVTLDVQAPLIDEVLFNNKDIIEFDFVKSKPFISAKINETESGIATLDFSIINCDTLLTTNYLQKFGDFVTGSILEITGNFTTAIYPGVYFLKLNVSDGAGNLATYTSPTFNVASGLQFRDTLNGPNPFNPNNGPTNIQYQLTEDASVDIYIFSISGEKLWHRQFAEGSMVGGSSGFNSVIWDGRNDYHETVANGVYLAYMKAKNSNHSAKGKIKIMVLK